MTASAYPNLASLSSKQRNAAPILTMQADCFSEQATLAQGLPGPATASSTSVNGSRLRRFHQTRRRYRRQVRNGCGMLAAIAMLAYSGYRTATYISVSNADVPANEAIGSEVGGVGAGGRNLLQNEELINEWFTHEELAGGAIMVYIVGIIYMFIAIAIVCDEFFVPALECITEDVGVSQDVAGATFMAAGGSAPELFTSFIGVFISRSNVGLGTIVGSAVFNILFVIGMCAIFSRETLTLTWWPLARDSTFYSIDLLLLAYFFSDAEIEWYEALILLLCYAMYVTFMAFNEKIYRSVRIWKRTLHTKTSGRMKKFKTNHTMAFERMRKIQNSVKFRMGALGWLVGRKRLQGQIRRGRSSDNIGGNSGNNTKVHVATDSNVEAKAPETKHDDYVQPRVVSATDAQADDIPKQPSSDLGIGGAQVTINAASSNEPDDHAVSADGGGEGDKKAILNGHGNGDDGERKEEAEGPDDDDNEPFTLEWPDSWHGRIVAILLSPISLSFFYTIPDPRRPGWRSMYPLTFLMSIIWIGITSYHMVWWAEATGRFWGIDPAIMGLTTLAAGTSIPDLITSVIVARQGFGDMAVSSSIGSNIFDVTIGLPLPWLLFTLIFQTSVTAKSKSLLASVILLFMMLVAVITTIACSHWKLTKALGGTMFILYFVFVASSLMIEYDWVKVS